MPRKVRVRRWQPGPRRSLTLMEKLDLAIGPRGRGEFSSERARREAWEEHRDEVLAFVNKTTRPSAWWQYDAPEPSDDGNELAQLQRLGLLSAEERALVAKWRAQDAERIHGGTSKAS